MEAACTPSAFFDYRRAAAAEDFTFMFALGVVTSMGFALFAEKPPVPVTKEFHQGRDKNHPNDGGIY